MKHLLLIIATCTAFVMHAKTQCLTRVKYSASKMEILDTAMNVLETKEESLTFETNPKGFTGIRVEDESDSLHGVLKSLTCDWKEPFKNGKITMVCDVQGKDHDMQDANITIDAEDGKIIILVRAKEQPDKIIRLVVDKYEEIK